MSNMEEESIWIRHQIGEQEALEDSEGRPSVSDYENSARV